MKKILFTATLRCHIGEFHQPYMKFFKESGWEVHVAARNNSKQKPLKLEHYDQFHHIDYERLPLKIGNIRAFHQLKNLLANNDYDIIHCHTPVAATLTRLIANRYRKNGLSVIYTAHGFHFFKGAPMKNWLLYFPIEKWLSRFTDCLITINEEDYRVAQDKHFKANRIELVSGVGVDLSDFTPQNPELRLKLRQEYGYGKDDFILLYAGNLSYRKHQDLIIEAVKIIHNQIPNLKVIFAGTGELESRYRKTIDQYQLENSIELIGYVRDIPNYMTLSDIVVSASRQEGLPVNILEAMATGLPIIATDCRGNRDLIKDHVNGRLTNIEDPEEMAQAILELFQTIDIRTAYGHSSLERIKQYGLENVLIEMSKIYTRYM